MFESSQALSLNSHENVLRIFAKNSSPNLAFANLQQECEKSQIAFPQFLSLQKSSKSGFAFEILVTGPQETLADIEKAVSKLTDFQIDAQKYSTLTLTCSGATSPQISQTVLATLAKNQITPETLIMSAMSASVLILQQNRIKALQALHALIPV